MTAVKIKFKENPRILECCVAVHLNEYFTNFRTLSHEFPF